MKLSLASASRRAERSVESHKTSPTQARPSTSGTIVGHETTIEDDYEDVTGAGLTEESSSYLFRQDIDAVSTASSIVSTGTKMSFRTHPQPSLREPATHATQTHPGPIDIVLGRRNFRITARPGSILSISSFDRSSSFTDHPAPPYEANAPTAGSTATLVQPVIEEDRDDLSYEEFESEIQQAPLQPIPRRPQQSTLLPSASSDVSDITSRPSSPPSPPLSPATTSANAISAHYTSVVRTIDTNYRAEIQRLQTELAQTRNSIDAAYRAEFRQIRTTSEAQIQELNAHVAEIEDLLDATISTATKERQATTDLHVLDISKLKSDHEKALSQLRADLQTERDEAVRKARNEIEDIWEGRWKDRMRLAGEEIGAAFDQQRRVALRWEEEIKRRWPDAGEDVRLAVEARLKQERAGERRRSSSAGTNTL